MSLFGVILVSYGVSLRMQFKCRKMQTRITPNTDTLMQWSWINELSWHHRLVIIIQVKGPTTLCFMHYSYAIIILFNTFWPAFSNLLLRKLIALSFCAFCVYFWCAEFDVIFLNFYNTCIIIVYIVCIRCITC